MKLIVGLGNPGREYEKTRHNIGFQVVDQYINYKNIPNLVWKNKFNGLYLETTLYHQKVIFLKPLSYMNLSGGVVESFVHFFKIDISDILIISDDLDLLVGNFKLKSQGSSGGHNGLKSIEQALGTNQYKRLKIGISNNKAMETKDYVLGKFSKKEQDIYENLYCSFNQILDDYFLISFEDLMSKYNQKNR